MLRIGMVGLAGVLASTVTANAQDPVERGRYLVDTVMTCQNCHTPMGPNGPQFDKALSGGLRFDEPPFDVTASNITPDRETGIGRWSDADIKKAIQFGVRPNGVRLAEIMPSGYYQILTPRDLDGIVAYLRSIPAVSNKVREPVYKMQLPHQVFPGAERAMPEADMADKVKRGFYLVTIAHCLECHTPFGPPGTGVDFQSSLGKGGREFHGPWGVSVSRNITSSKTKGIGDWSDADVKRDHARRAQGRQQAQAAHGLSLLRQDDRRRRRSDGCLSADLAGERVSATFSGAHGRPSRRRRRRGRNRR